MPTLVRRAAKVLFYLLLAIIIARVIGDPYKFFNENMVVNIAYFFFDSVTQEELDEIYYDINYLFIFSVTAILYYLIMKIARYARQKRRA
ncbi:MAG: hypothetical protein ABN478_01900 [Mixta sp.]